MFASSPQWAAQVAEAAEQHRRELAEHWLGEELPPWSQRCPVHVMAGANLGAGGETRYMLSSGGAGEWMMSVQGTPERILDSVLPHEITHTIFATYFAKLGKYMPRWADEGACTTVEHVSEKRKHEHYLRQFLQTGRGLAFNQMFQLKEYPADILPLYAQGHSAVQFLLDQGGPRKFIAFVEDGMRTEAWTQALQDHYAYLSIGEFQTQWNRWLANGSPASLVGYAPLLDATPASDIALASSGQVALANHAQIAATQPVANPSPLSLASSRGAQAPAESRNVSWYQRRLHEVTGERSPKYDGRPAYADPLAVATSSKAAVLPLPPQGAVLPNSIDLPGSASHTMQTQTRPSTPSYTGIQVLDWGNAPPVRGIQTANQDRPIYYDNAPAMVPVYR
ncbi:MAG: hypothetical protein KDB22_02055 [Planctomycetales bacterium]|nr:hypothetical protein [Planctomycetales bacterium]